MNFINKIVRYTSKKCIIHNPYLGVGRTCLGILLGMIRNEIRLGKYVRHVAGEVVIAVSGVQR